MASIVNEIHREVKVIKSFKVIRTMISGCKTFYKAGDKTIYAQAGDLIYQTVQEMFGDKQRPLTYLPYDKKNFDLLTHAIIRLDNYVFEITLDENVRGKLGYRVDMFTEDFRLIKKTYYTIDGDLADNVNYPVDGQPSFVGDYILVMHDILFKEKIDYDNGNVVLGIVNK